MTNALAHSWYMTQRHLQNLWRQPAWVVMSLAQPLIYLLLCGALFKRVVEIPGFGGGSYVDFLTPGIVAMTALFSAGWSGMGLMEDLDRGVIDRFLVAPASRGALIFGRLIQLSIVTVIQSAIITSIGLLLGAHYPGGLPGMLVLVLCSILLGASFGALSNGLALLVRKEETVIAAVNIVLLPLTFLSAVFMQQRLMPMWVQDVARYNPVNWAVQAGRAAMGTNADWGMVWSHAGYLVAMLLVCSWVSTRAFRAYQRAM